MDDVFGSLSAEYKKCDMDVFGEECYAVFFFKQKTAYEMRISDWSSDVCSSDLLAGLNLVGLKRRGFGRDDINALRSAFRDLFQEEGELAARIEAVAADGGSSPLVAQLLEFVRADSGRKILQIGRASCRERVCQYG